MIKVKNKRMFWGLREWRKKGGEKKRNQREKNLQLFKLWEKNDRESKENDAKQRKLWRECEREKEEWKKKMLTVGENWNKLRNRERRWWSSNCRKMWDF